MVEEKLMDKRKKYKSESSRSSSSNSSQSSSSYSSSSRSNRKRSASKSRNDKKPETCLKMRVKNLTRNVNKNHVNEIFCVYGEIKRIDLQSNRMHPEFNDGSCVIEYAKEEYVKKAVKMMDCGQIDGRIVSCSIFRHLRPIERSSISPKRRLTRYRRSPVHMKRSPYRPSNNYRRSRSRSRYGNRRFRRNSRSRSLRRRRYSSSYTSTSSSSVSRSRSNVKSRRMRKYSTSKSK
ncbi:hypothetical protein A3Q56_05278 [Intoshia linei]|uniref:RRM domain-containing protein n=1 Tax=Intoshia linei TaxID=1819745 RepID=A0A177AY95_9BILA|nr:hypothetical protein A3Q56_05278 [Intoshia linei]